MNKAPAADAAGLAALQQAQRRRIAFENIDVLLGRGIDIAPDAIFAKLVTRARGGYCFEQNALFLRALKTLGFNARPLLGRVWLNAAAFPAGGVPPRTHTFNLVRLPDGDWIADAGFGGGDPHPMPLRPGDIMGAGGVRHTLAHDHAHGWMLTRNGIPQYSFTQDEVWPSDLAQANHWTATAPASRFLKGLVVSLLAGDDLHTLNLPLRAAGPALNREEVSERLSREFNIHLTAEERAQLPTFQTG